MVEACAALAQVDVGEREQMRLALRCTLVKRVEDEAVFDALFERRFALRRPVAPPSGATTSPTSEDDLLDRIVGALAAGDDLVLDELADEAAQRHGGFGTANGSDRYHLQRTLRALRPHTLAHDALRLRRGDVSRRDEGVERVDRAEIQTRLDRFLAALAGATRRQQQQARPGVGEAADDDVPYVRVEDLEIAEASVVELRRLRQAVRPLARRLAARIARRRARPQGTLDVRRTIRRSLAAGGVPLDPLFRRRQPHRADLWLLCDVSGSVAEFARFTIGLLTAVHDEVPKLRSFLFVDDLVEVTALLAARTHEVDPFALVAGAGAPLGGRQSDWGTVLARFREEHGPTLTRRSTVVLTGDARTHGRDPRTDVVDELARRTRGVWLLDPEPRAQWSTDDAVVGDYRAAGAHVLEVRTLAQLAAAVEHIVVG